MTLLRIKTMSFQLLSFQQCLNQLWHPLLQWSWYYIITTITVITVIVVIIIVVQIF